METSWEFWLPVVVNLLFWLAIVAGIAYVVARAVVRKELSRSTFVSTEPERKIEPPPRDL